MKSMITFKTETTLEDLMNNGAFSEGAMHTLNRVAEAEKLDELEDYIMNSNGLNEAGEPILMDFNELDDFIDYEESQILEDLGIEDLCKD